MKIVRYSRPKLMWVPRFYGGGLLPQIVVGEIVGELSGCETIWCFLAKRGWFRRDKHRPLRWFSM